MFSKLYNNKYRVINNDTSYYKYDATLPRTQRYICKNKDCKTNTKGANKEAVIFRKKNSYVTNYLCTVCDVSWVV